MEACYAHGLYHTCQSNLLMKSVLRFFCTAVSIKGTAVATKIEAQLVSRTTTECAVVSPVFTDTTFLHTDIGRTRTDRFSSAAFRLITLPFFTNFFIAGGRAFRQAVVVKGVWVRLLGYVPLFLRLYEHFFHNKLINRGIGVAMSCREYFSRGAFGPFSYSYLPL